MSNFTKYLIEPKDDQLPSIRIPSKLKRELLQEFGESEHSSFAQFLISRILSPGKYHV